MAAPQAMVLAYHCLSALGAFIARLLGARAVARSSNVIFLRAIESSPKELSKHIRKQHMGQGTISIFLSVWVVAAVGAARQAVKRA